MSTPDTEAAQSARSLEPVGKAALIASVGGTRGYADWTNPDHRLRRLLAEFLGMAGLTFILSGGAAILARYGGHALQPWQTVLVLSAVSALWLVVAVYFLGDISAHFNPATTLAFALRRDMGWIMAGAYWIIQFAAAVCGSLLARGFFGPAGNLAATMPKPGQSWQAAGFEAIITFGLVLMILNLANGPKLNGPFVPLAVGAYIMAWGTMGGPYDGASMNPARSFGPDLVLGNLSTWWVYLIGPLAGAVIAVGVAYVLRGPARAQEASAAQGTPLDRDGFAGAWPGREAAGGDDAPFAKQLGDVRKVVVSRQRLEFSWRNSELIKGDLLDAVTSLKADAGIRSILIPGSISVVQQLLAAGLVDELRLLVDPVAARKGRRLFDDGDAPYHLKMTATEAFPTGVIRVIYSPAKAPANVGYDEVKDQVPGRK